VSFIKERNDYSGDRAPFRSPRLHLSAP
jgi:hypothetical protein